MKTGFGDFWILLRDLVWVLKVVEDGIKYIYLKFAFGQYFDNETIILL